MTSMFTLDQAAREAALTPALAALVEHHRANCEPYDRILAALPDHAVAAIADVPWLPVRLFKDLALRSVPEDEVFTVLTSSGTTGDVSRVHLDAPAAAAQQRALAATLATVTGPKRLPMLLVDSRAPLAKRRAFSARGAGVLGLMNLGRDHTFVLDEHGRPDPESVRAFLARHGHAPFLVFGFTFMVWEYLYRLAADEGLDLGNGILIHSGGWKKLADRAVGNTEFRRSFADKTGLRHVHNFYGMVEQIGVIHLEGPDGHLYSPDNADVVIRDPLTWRENPVGVPGVIEVVSTLPRSYPGNALLTEDLGVVHGVDDGAWPGKHFSVFGRLPRSQARGCSDTYQEAA
ncbi:acyl-protein synthetase [Stackebrandtia soli]|uniref:LuxE/PaaK family acyltransferase n=1 Tax=Stackebrandtia soli TaxID=1892856 RepID=UPI0039EBB41A